MAAEPEDLTDAGPGPFATPRAVPSRPRTAVRKRVRKAKASPATEPVGDESAAPKPKRSGTTGAERARQANRVPQSKWMGALVSFVGRNAERAGTMEPGSPLVPFGRAMQFNAPIAGATFDDAVKGSWVDTKAQPLLRRGDKFQAFGNAIGFPMLILAMTSKPELWEMLAPVAFEMFEANIESMGPMIVAKAKKDRATQETIDKAVKEGMLPTWRDPATGVERNPTARELFESLFAPAPQPPAEDGDPLE